MAVELVVDPDQPCIKADVCPAEAQGLTDAQARVGQEVEQRPVEAAVVEQQRELLAFEDRGALRSPARLLCGFELGDWVAGKPTTACGVAADLPEHDQSLASRRGRERALVGGRPGSDPVNGEVAHLAGPNRSHARIT